MQFLQAQASMRSTALHRRDIVLPLLLITGLYGFVLSLTGFKDAWALAFSVESSGNAVQAILDASLSSSYTALLSGIVITSLIQSSSATITNTIVGLAHSHQPEQFRRMTPATLVDDIYKMLNVALFFVLLILSLGLMEEARKQYLHDHSREMLNKIFGGIIFLTVPGLRMLPIRIAEHIASLMGRSPHAPLILLAYVGLLFFGLPLLVIFAGRLIS